MRILVVDDEKPCLDELVYMLSKQKNVQIAGTFTSSPDALDASSTLDFDAAFLDLSMPRLSGAELARLLLAQNPCLKLVFVTAYAKELAKLRMNPAVGSLLKPVTETKLREALRLLSD